MDTGKLQRVNGRASRRVRLDGFHPWSLGFIGMLTSALPDATTRDDDEKTGGRSMDVKLGGGS
jgi:hypothetical protein